MSDSKKTFDGLSPAAQEQWRELAVLPPAQALSRLQQGATSAPMTSLPKRGDRVRVTEKLSGSFLQVGDAITLIEDARPCPNWGVGACECIYEGRNGNGFGRTWSGAVKVEILERAAIRCDYGGDCPGHASPEDRPCGYVHPEFARGMRRAVEIAEGLSWKPANVERVVTLAELKDAIEEALK